MISRFASGDRFSPAITTLANGNHAVAFGVVGRPSQESKSLG